MKNYAGIWIDTKKAVVVHLNANEPIVRVIESGIEKRTRIPGEGKQYARFGNQYLDFEKRKENRLDHEIKNFLEEVINEVKVDDEILVIGPSAMKTELEKLILKNKIPSPAIRAVEPADSMTENQIVAYVKQFFQDNNH